MCGGNFTIEAGNIATPGYPRNYPANLHCEWLITLNSNHRINLTILDFDVEAHSECNLDSLTIYDGDVIAEGKKLLKYCGERKPNQTSYISSKNSMLITFDTDSLIGYKGFMLYYRLVKKLWNSIWF